MHSLHLHRSMDSLSIIFDVITSSKFYQVLTSAYFNRFTLRASMNWGKKSKPSRKNLRMMVKMNSYLEFLSRRLSLNLDFQKWLNKISTVENEWDDLLLEIDQRMIANHITSKGFQSVIPGKKHFLSLAKEQRNLPTAPERSNVTLKVGAV